MACSPLMRFTPWPRRSSGFREDPSFPRKPPPRSMAYRLRLSKRAVRSISINCSSQAERTSTRQTSQKRFLSRLITLFVQRLKDLTCSSVSPSRNSPQSGNIRVFGLSSVKAQLLIAVLVLLNLKNPLPLNALTHRDRFHLDVSLQFQLEHYPTNKSDKQTNKKEKKGKEETEEERRNRIKELTIELIKLGG